MDYFASLFFKAEYENKAQNKDPLWEEVGITINDESIAKAEETAIEFALSQECEYLAEGQTIKWKFVKIERISKVESTKNNNV